MELTQVKAEFIIISKELSLKQMTDTLGFTGDYAGDKNDVIRNGQLRGESFIELCTEYEDSLDIHEQYSKLIARVEDIKKNIISVLETGKICCRFCIVIIIEKGNTPAMYLDSDFINLMHELRAEIEFDTYANPYNSEE
jgi:hypothetical protein